jgi:[ribosomal protein S5]-alanine N-acetyltransferase
VHQITTERLYLKLVSPNDFEFIFRLVNSKDWIAFIGDRNVDSPEAAKQYIDRIIATPNFNYWVIREKHSDSPVGIISFIKRDYLPHFDVGFAILPECYGHGYAMEATRELITEYKMLGHETILATVMPANIRSIQLLVKLGFILLQDLEVNQERLHVFGWGACQK